MSSALWPSPDQIEQFFDCWNSSYSTYSRFPPKHTYPGTPSHIPNHGCTIHPPKKEFSDENHQENCSYHEIRILYSVFALDCLFYQRYKSPRSEGMKKDQSHSSISCDWRPPMHFLHYLSDSRYDNPDHSGISISISSLFQIHFCQAILFDANRNPSHTFGNAIGRSRSEKGIQHDIS